MSERLIDITTDEIQTVDLIRFVTTPQAGAVILFLGTVRELTQGRRTLALDYEAYPEMAVKVMSKIADEACAQWPVSRLAMVHRLGRLELTETSVAIAVSSPHRQDAYAASQYLIDELKKRVPVWKKENWDDGSTEWIHPEPSPAITFKQ
ncbi:molybdenum cofactor biosynthesis protein MoaE [Planctomicrobium sp. SH668]|uniref:molybdenum cofactor biosynthesis protein MoaE n=1 Tax=Planctomicrobium sp. SH668 TaxID=3448126 RepID=UPI003F5BC653